MSDKFQVDSHKLHYHPERVSEWIRSFDDWQKARSIYPIYMEIAPVGTCNHRCVFCAMDFIGYQTRSLNEEILRERLTEMAALGVKGIMFAGEGEPTLWKPLPQILEHCTNAGIDTSLTTNMVPFNEKNIEFFVRNCAWIKTSIDGGTADTYSKIHRSKPSDFDRVLDNFRMCVKLKKEKNYQCTLGAQMILLPENSHEAYTLGKILKDIGADYLVIKPYSQHFKSITRIYEGIDYRPFCKLEDELTSLNGDGFSIIFRARTMEKLRETERPYDVCYATPFFWAYIMSDGSVYGCSAYLQDERFNYGNIHEQTFRDIWEGEKRKVNLDLIRNELSIEKCRKICRMDEINRYLWKLRHPDRHRNFI